MISLFVSLATIVALGWLVVRLALGASAPSKLATTLQCLLGLGLGLGIASCSLFVTGLLADALTPMSSRVELGGLLAAVGVLYFLDRKSTRSWPIEPPAASSQSLLFWILGLSFALAAFAVLWRCIETVETSPHGGWDAWAIWNARARFLFRADENWTHAFLVARGHPDYPLLLPLTIARFWTYLGTDTVAVPQTIAVASLAVTVALLVTSLALLRGWEQAWLGGLVLICTPSFVEHASFQDADITLAFFFLGTTVLLCVGERRGRGLPVPAALAGAMAAAAAWTKNEGILFALLVIVGVSAHALASHGGRGARRAIALICAGMLPIGATLVLFKLSYAPVNDLVEGQSFTHYQDRLLDWPRYAIVARGFVQIAVYVIGGFGVVLPLYFALRATSKGWKFRMAIPGTTAALAVVGSMIVGYFFVYILTPLDLQNHVHGSAARLLFQLWPSILFLLFMVGAPKEEVRQRPKGLHENASAS